MPVEPIDKRKSGHSDAFPVWRDKILLVIPAGTNIVSSLFPKNGRITKMICVLPSLEIGSIPILKFKNEDTRTLYDSGTLTANSENLIEQDIDICGVTTIELTTSVNQTAERKCCLYFIGV
jgi:hypothetical protein